MGKIEEIYNYLELTNDIATGGQPSEAQLSDVAAAGYDVVINLAPHDVEQALPDERRAVESLGMEYVHIPVIWREPKSADLERFFQVMEANRGRKVFVHCQANMRVSVFLALYRTLRLGWEWKDAYQDIDRVWTPTGWWRDFIEAQLQEKREE